MNAGSFAFAKLHDLYTLNFQPSESDVFGTTTELKVAQLVIDYYLALYPVFTISASFPIICITLRNTLHDVCTSSYKWLFYRCDCCAASRAGACCTRVADFLLFERPRLVFAALVLLPPAAIALLTTNVTLLVSVTGNFAGVGIQYVAPALLVVGARAYLSRHLQATRSLRSSDTSSSNGSNNDSSSSSGDFGEGRSHYRSPARVFGLARDSWYGDAELRARLRALNPHVSFFFCPFWPLALLVWAVTVVALFIVLHFLHF